MIAAQIVLEARLLGRVEARAENGDRRAQLMGGVGREAALPRDAGVEPSQRAIDGLDERNDLRRHALQRQTLMQRVHVDARRLGGDGVQRTQAPAHSDPGGRAAHQNRHDEIGRRPAQVL